MQDKLAIISRVIDEHQTLRRHMKLAGDTVNDAEALMSLEQVAAGWPTGKRQVLLEKYRELVQTLARLSDGMKNHFAFEEKELPSVLGETLMRALAIEHRDLSRKVAEATAQVTALDFDGLSEAEVPARMVDMRQAVSQVTGSIEGHARREEVLIGMVQEALTSESQD